MVVAWVGYPVGQGSKVVAQRQIPQGKGNPRERIVEDPKEDEAGNQTPASEDVDQPEDADIGERPQPQGKEIATGSGHPHQRPRVVR